MSVKTEDRTGFQYFKVEADIATVVERTAS